MKPFLYRRGSKNYARFLVPIHLQAKLGKRFLVFALGEGAGHELRLKAHQLEHYLSTKLLHNDSMKRIRKTKPKAAELDVFFDDDYDISHFENINDDDDLRRAKELLEFSASLKQKKTSNESAPHQAPALQPAPEPAPVVKGLKMIELVDKFFLLKSHLKPATVQSYKNTALEFQKFLKNPNLTSILISDVTRFQ